MQLPFDEGLGKKTAEASNCDSVITVWADVVENTITPLMSGACIEDVNHELYGGLYAQIVFGESFEEPPKIVPLPEWSYREGEWRVTEEDVLQVFPPLFSSKTVWDEAVLGDGIVECDMILFDDSGENAGLILRVNNPRRGADAFFGYEVSISAKNDYVRLGKHENNWIHLCDAPVKLQPEKWYRLKVELDAGRIQVFVGDTGKPQIDYTDPNPLKPGRVGLRTWNSKAGFRRLRVTSGDKTWTEDFTSKQVLPYEGEVSGMWDGFVTGDAEASFKWDDKNSLNTDYSQMIKVKSVTEGTAGVANRGLNRWGICIREGRTYEGRLYLRGEYNGEVTIALQDAAGTKTYAMQKLNGVSSDWGKYPIRLISNGTDMDTRLAVWIDQPGVIWLDQVVLMPTGEELFKGLPVRADIAQEIVEEGLTVLRLGGSMINASGYKWKTMIGNPDKRLQYKGTWYPCSTRGFVIEEFIQFCRKADIEPVVAINIFEEPEDAEDLIEYLNGPSTSRWGKVRAENGYPEPYNVRYIEIGNEEQNNPLYLERFLMLYEAMRPKDPGVQFIIGCWWMPDNPNSREIVCQLNGKAAMWDLHVGGDNLRDGDKVEGIILQMQRLLQEWAPGTSLKACILEENGGLHNLQRALGHAHIRNTAERFGDFILIECPANCLQPDGQNDNDWDQGQVFFNNNQVWFQPPAYAQQMAARHYRPYRLKSHISCPNDELDVTATKSKSGDTIVLKVVNIGESSRRTMIKIEGIDSIAPMAKTVVLTGDLRAIDTADNPHCIAPVEGFIEDASTAFTYTFEGYSYTVIESKNAT